LVGIAHQEGKTDYIGGSASAVVVIKADEQWILDTYAKCLRVATGMTPKAARELVAKG